MFGHRPYRDRLPQPGRRLPQLEWKSIFQTAALVNSTTGSLDTKGKNIYNFCTTFPSAFLPSRRRPFIRENNDCSSVLFPTCSIPICPETMLIMAIIASINILTWDLFLRCVAFFFKDI